MRAMVTGGAGFIGAALVRALAADPKNQVATVDKLTYAASLERLDCLNAATNHSFHRIDIADGRALGRVFDAEAPDVVFHLAAESHVDRSIDAPADFIHSNVVGTFQLLTESLRYWRSLSAEGRSAFGVVHVSTDEVFGSLQPNDFFSGSPHIARTRRTPHPRRRVITSLGRGKRRMACRSW